MYAHLRTAVALAAIALLGQLHVAFGQVNQSDGPQTRLASHAASGTLVSNSSVTGCDCAADACAADACAGGDCDTACDTCGGYVGGGGGCYCVGSCWLFSTDALILSRTDAADLTLITDQGTGAELLNVKDLNIDGRVGPRLSLIRQRTPADPSYVDGCLDWEITFFGIEWNESAAPLGPTSPVLNLPGTPLPSSAPGFVYDVSYGSDLYSTELNLRRCWTDCCTILAGFRWVELGEDLIANEIGGGVTNVFNVDTNNHMYGFQLGAESEVWNCGGRLHLDAFVKAGIFYNRADQSTYAPGLTAFAPVFVDRLSDSDDHTAFLGETGLRVVYHLTDMLAVRGGYQVLWIEGVALAPDQLASMDLTAPGTAVLDTSGSPFYHGAFVGLEASW